MKNGVKFSISIFHVPDYAGPNPVSHLNTRPRTAVYEFIGSHSNLFLDMTFNHNTPWCNG